MGHDGHDGHDQRPPRYDLDGQRTLVEKQGKHGDHDQRDDDQHRGPVDQERQAGTAQDQAAWLNRRGDRFDGIGRVGQLTRVSRVGLGGFGASAAETGHNGL